MSASAIPSFGVMAASTPTSRFLQRAQPYFYVLPAAAFVGYFLLYPMVVTLWQSFTRYDGITDPVFIGFGNFRALFLDPHFLLSLRNTLIILFKQGYSAAIAVVISIAAIAFSYLYLRSVLDQESHV